MKNTFGFTLIELLIAIAVISIISVVAIRVLYDTVATKAVHYAISGSNQEVRALIGTLTTAIQSANNVAIPNSTTLSLRGDPCQTIRQNGTQLEIATAYGAGCIPPTSNFVPLTNSHLVVSNFSLSPITAMASYLNLYLDGTYTDNLGTHAYQYQTTVNPRVNF